MLTSAIINHIAVGELDRFDMKVLFMTQNEADFRMKWMDELARYAEITVFHVDEYAQSYAKYKTVRAHTRDISRNIFSKKIFRLKEFKKESYDLLILDGYGFLAQQLLIIYLKQKKIPYVLSLDGVNLSRCDNKIKFFIKSYFIAGAIAYLSTSEQTDEYVRRYVGKEAIIYRHFFSSVSEKQIMEKSARAGKQEIRNRLGIDNQFTVIAVGRFTHGKGFDVLLKALKYVSPDIRVLFVGGDNADSYRDYIDDSIRERVRFIPFCNAELLSEYYKASDVFVLPTRHDVWGLVVGEAMSYGLPVITTDMCMAGLTMIEEGVNGYLVRVGDEHGLAEKIDFLYFNPNVCEKMGCNNIEIIKQYSIEVSSKIDIKNLKSIYEGQYEDCCTAGS